MRRLVFCFDGSWNGLKVDKKPTNVQLIAEAIKPRDADDGSVQIVYYDEGVGTRSDEVFRGGAFGKGIRENLREAYRFLIFNYEKGDEIFCFGFSRGGFTAMAFVGLIRSIGILQTSDANLIDRGFKLYHESSVEEGVDSERLRDFRAKYCPQYCVSASEFAWRRAHVPDWPEHEASTIEIKYLGVWDAVGSLGWKVLGALFRNTKEQIYSQYLTQIDKFVLTARHAVSIDERRKVFKPTLWKNLDNLNAGVKSDQFDDRRPFQQKWFPGDHGSVGGGGEYDGWSRGTLQWIVEGASRERLAIDVEGRSQLSKLRYDTNTPLHNTRLSFFGEIANQLKSAIMSADRGSPESIDDLSHQAARLWLSDKTYRPALLDRLIPEIEKRSTDFRKREIPVDIGYHEYVIQARDELDKISLEFFGSSEHSELLFDVNRDLLDSPSYIGIGETIRIPKSVF